MTEPTDHAAHPALIGRSEANLKAVTEWVAETPWVEFLAKEPETRSCTSICLSIVDPWFLALETAKQKAVTKSVSELLEVEGVAYDINGYRDAPPGLRIWGGATVELDDMHRLLPWLDWAFAQVRAQRTAA